MNPIHITKLDHIVMRVTNIEKSIRFYRDILGCPEKRISNGLYQYQAGASMIDLVPITEDLRHDPDCRPTEKYLNVDHFALTLAEFDEKAIVAYLEANNIKVERSGRRFGAQLRLQAQRHRNPKRSGWRLCHRAGGGRAAAREGAAALDRAGVDGDRGDRAKGREARGAVAHGEDRRARRAAVERGGGGGTAPWGSCQVPAELELQHG